MSEDDRALRLVEDEMLMARFRSGEVEAFDRLMALYMDQVFGIAWSTLHDREAALDATQEVFIKLYKAIPRFAKDSNLPAWLYRVCLNHCIDLKRKRSASEYGLTEEEWDRLQGPETNDPKIIFLNNETRRQIREAVDSLPPRQRSAFILRHYKFMSQNEIALAMGCSVGAVKSHLSRATQNLRKKLGDELRPAAKKR